MLLIEVIIHSSYVLPAGEHASEGAVVLLIEIIYLAVYGLPA